MPQLIPAEDVSSDEDTATVSWHIHGIGHANIIYTCFSVHTDYSWETKQLKV